MDKSFEKQKCHQHKRLLWINNKDVNKIVVSNKVSLGKKGFKYFIGYKDPKKFRPKKCIQNRLS